MSNKVRAIKEVSLRLTLLSIPTGETMLFPNKKWDSGTVRSAVSRLNKYGHNYTTTIKGINGGINVTNNAI